jgi:hypothetical protein
VTIVVLLILAVVWALVLVPPALRARTEARPADSITAFRRQLTTLQRTGPFRAVTVQPVHPDTRVADAPQFPVPAAASTAAPVPAVARQVARLQAARPATKAQVQKRRRDIFIGLVAAAVISLLFGAVPGLHILLLVHLLADALLATYCAVLIRIRHAAAEREMRVRFMPGSAQVEPALLYRRPGQ